MNTRTKREIDLNFQTVEAPIKKFLCNFLEMSSSSLFGEDKIGLGNPIRLKNNSTNKLLVVSLLSCDSKKKSSMMKWKYSDNKENKDMISFFQYAVEQVYFSVVNTITSEELKNYLLSIRLSYDEKKYEWTPIYETAEQKIVNYHTKILNKLNNPQYVREKMSINDAHYMKKYRIEKNKEEQQNIIKDLNKCNLDIKNKINLGIIESEAEIFKFKKIIEKKYGENMINDINDKISKKFKLILDHKCYDSDTYVKKNGMFPGKTIYEE